MNHKLETREGIKRNKPYRLTLSAVVVKAAFVTIERGQGTIGVMKVMRWKEKKEGNEGEKGKEV